jgi:predicted metal-binding membrane protein
VLDIGVLVVSLDVTASAPQAQNHPGGAEEFVSALNVLGVVALLFALAGLAWWSTVKQMAGMSAAPGTDLGTLGWFMGVWVVMMVAMMLPSVAPTAGLYARMTRQRSPVRPLLFTAAYVLVWCAAGLLAYACFELGKAWFGAHLSWGAGGRWLAAAVLTAAALYELTPVKSACLSKCCGPAALLHSWRDVSAGSIHMGVRNAAWCVGCCGALMTALFALGVMSIEWMAVIAALITVQKVIPWQRLVRVLTFAILLGLATMVVVAPQALPGLVIPSSGAASTMGMMN